MSLLPIPFNNPDTYPGHSGVDFGQSSGTPFRASGPGVVTVLGGYNSRAGNTIWVRYDVGCTVGYAHMNSHSGCPSPGTRVSEGTLLGYVGYSGHVIPPGPQGAHLHAEVEGYSTTSGFWKWFTPNRVVGHGAPSKDDEMTPEQANQLAAVYAALFGPANLGVSKTTWKKPFNEKGGEAYYGMFDVLIDTQHKLAKLSDKVDELNRKLSN